VTLAPHKDECCTLGSGGGDEVVVVPWPLLLRQRAAHRVHSSDRYRWWVLLAVLGGLFAVNVTFTILNVALPRIARELGTTTNTLTWVITGPLLAFGITAPTFGKAGDVYGYKKVYLLGIGGAAICSALSALAWNAGSLIAIRTLGSIEGAATGAASVALICTVFERGDRVKALGYWSLVGAGGPVLGLAIGGPLIQHFGWRVIFAGQVPLEVLAIGFAAIVLPETTKAQRERIDWAGVATLGIAATSVLFAINRGPEWGWSSPGVVLTFLLCPAAGVLFVAVERRAAAPLLPLALLRRPNFAWPIMAQLFAEFAYMGGFFLSPLLLERVLGYTEAHAGILVGARPLAFSITAPVAGYLAVRWGERLAAVVGSAVVVASMLVFAMVGAHSSDVLTVTALALSGIGLGICSPSISASVANAVDEANLGIASATQQLTMQVGVVAGIQLMSTVQTAREHTAGLAGSFSAAYLVGGAVAVLGVFCAFFVRSADREVGEAVGHAAGSTDASLAATP
jgi:EmrB/QacA subfamily drug resistance transporter